MTTSKVERDRYALPGTGPTDDDLRYEVELTRQELGDTVAELVHKVDVPGRVREAAQRRMAVLHDTASVATEAAHGLADSVRRRPMVFAAGGVAALVALVLALLRFIR